MDYRCLLRRIASQTARGRLTRGGEKGDFSQALIDFFLADDLPSDRPHELAAKFLFQLGVGTRWDTGFIVLIAIQFMKEATGTSNMPDDQLRQVCECIRNALNDGSEQRLLDCLGSYFD